jgi:hypothetical protein
MTDPTDQATATEVYRRLTESPEQRRERAAQEFMTANGLDELVCVAPDGRKMVYLSPAAEAREAKQRALELRLLQQRAELDRQFLQAAKKAAKENADADRIHLRLLSGGGTL